MKKPRGLFNYKRQLIIYVIATAVLIISNLLMEVMVETIINYNLRPKGHLVFMFTSVVAALCFYPFIWLLNRLFNKVMPLPGQQATERLLAFSRSLSEVQIHENIGEKIVSTILSVLNLSAGALVRIERRGTRTIYSVGFETDEVDSALDIWRKCESVDNTISLNGQWTYVRLNWQGQVVGVLIFRYKEAKAFDHLQREILETLASQSAVAIINRELYEELSGTNALMNSFIDNLSSYIVAWNRRGRIVLVNKNAVLSSGRTEDELLQTGINNLPHIRSLFRALKREGLGLSDEIHDREIIMGDRTFSVSLIPFEVENETMYSLILADITDIKDMQSKVARAERLSSLGTMTAGLAHEIRNGLHGIRGFADILSEELKENLPLRTIATGIVEDTERISRILSNFLLFARKPRLQLDKVDLDEILNTSIALVNRLAHEKKINFLLNSPPQEVILNGDKDKLYQVFLNLLLNAAEAVKTTRIKITVKYTEFEAVVIIQDNGGGIDKQDLERIFDPFFTTKSHGTGLGLSIVNQLIEEHGGRVDLTNANNGTRVSVSLPLKGA